jgi:arabinose-5-phosphate isomerase
LAKASNVFLNTHVEKEACPLGLAPTSSTTTTLVMGDALAVALLGVRGFTEEDFARSHPGGRLGRRLLLHVHDVMVTDSNCPRCNETATLADALMEISSQGLGMVAVENDAGQLVGIFTDGDLRRTLATNADIHTLQIDAVMTKTPATTELHELAVNAVSLMQELKITSLPVVDAGKLQGVVTMHALLAAGVV